MGLISVCQPEPELRRVTMLGWQHHCWVTLNNRQTSWVAAAVLLDHWYLSKQRIFLSCDVVKGVGYYHGIFM